MSARAAWRAAGWQLRTALAVLVAAALRSAPAADAGMVYERPAHKPVAEVLEDLEFAISDRNFRITGRLHVGQGIRESDHADFPEYEVLLFCNLGYARRMLELDPGMIIYCPGRVTVRDAGGVTRIAAPLLPEPASAAPALQELVRKINTSLRAIVDYGAEPWDRHAPHRP
jgi:uncharacterized protein (DUF302 family)